ncbi:hypothetical protein [Dactylosporangium sp. CA-233914]|uniref:hypothetical protein n=1 Tax=Dactylosporangium sp. CA-233914 TaxID=3239934 RepID=UPI003D8CAD61
MRRHRKSPRAQLAAERGWRYARSGSGDIERRWHTADLDPSDEVAGTLGLPFTVFDTTVLGAPDRAPRTVCVLHLPVELPPAAVIPDPANGEPCAEGRVGPVPPWAALAFQHPPELDGAPPPEHPDFADALVTGGVLDLTRRRGLIGWRIAGRDLIWVSRPGAPLPPERLVAVIESLAELAAALPADIVARYRRE